MLKNNSVPFFDYYRQYKKIEPQITRALNKVLSANQLILGIEVGKLEKSLAKHLGVKYAIGVNSGTDALKIALKASGLGRGDEVITVANTFIATVSAIRELGAKPVFVDIKDDFTLDENKISSAITPRTKAIIPVHLYGQLCNMPAIMAIAKKYRLTVIEDAAQAISASLGDKKGGSFGHLACFSFYPTKNLGAYGDGGLIATNNRKLAKTCRCLRVYGTSKKNFAELEGYNSRLDEIQAAFLNVKLPHLNRWNQQRQTIAKTYLTKITNPKIILPAVKKINEHCFHLFVIKIKNRKSFINHLNKNKIGYGIHYPYPINQQTAYKFLKLKKQYLPKTYQAMKEIVSLPIFPELTEKEINYVIKILNAY